MSEVSEFTVGVLHRLSQLEANQSRMLQFLNDAKTQMAEIVARHETMLVGDISHPGLFVRLDRLEQAQARRDRWLLWGSGAVGSALVGIALKVFF